MKTIIEETDKYYIFENNNKFSKKKYSLEESTKANSTLINCSFCTDSEYLENSHHTVNCHNGKELTYCEDCSDCSNCDDCVSCSESHYCNSSSDLTNCTECHDCDDLDKCYDCVNLVGVDNYKGVHLKEPGTIENGKIIYLKDSEANSTLEL